MKKLFLLSLSSLAVLTQATSHDQVVLEETFDSLRGGIQGFYRGIYNHPQFELDDRCLGPAVQDAFENLEYIVFNAKFGRVMDIIEDSYIISSDTDRFCFFEASIVDITEYCGNPKHCQFEKMPKNL